MLKLTVNDFLGYPEPPEESNQNQKSVKGHPALEDCILVSPKIPVYVYGFMYGVCQLLNYIIDNTGKCVGYFMILKYGGCQVLWTNEERSAISSTPPALPNSVDANFVCDVYDSYISLDIDLEAIPLDFAFWGITTVYYSCNDIRQYVPLDVFIDKLYKQFIDKNIELPNLCNDYRGIEDLFDGLVTDTKNEGDGK